MKPPDFLEFDVAGAKLGALRWEGIDGARTVVAVHGITSNGWAWDPVAHHLAGGANLVALDLRGRGRSFDVAGPFGIRRHADDVAAVIEQLGGPALVAGHSMGAFVAMMAAARHPDLVQDVVLVDGGPRLPIVAGSDIDEVLDATLGPAIDRLRTTWPDRVSYYSMWSQHPAYAGGISVDLERNLLADLVEVDDGFRTAVNEAAVRIDGREMLADDEVRELLDRRDAPTVIIRAHNGLMGTPPPLITTAMRGSYPQHRWIEAAGTNHYTVLVGPKGAELVAESIRHELAGT
jgi:pimeloyl-ACP methyl ester carboxylesterase